MTKLPVTTFAPLTPEIVDEIAALARKSRDAAGPLMRSVQGLGRMIDKGLSDRVPAELRPHIETATGVALQKAFEAAAWADKSSWLPELPDWGHKAVATSTGALAGLLPVAGSVAEIPFAVTLIFSAMLREAKAQGFDPSDEAVRLEALSIFGDASPFPDDDSTDTSFVALRIGLAAGGLNAILSKAAARLATVLGPKLAAGAVPIAGAIAGGGINLAYMRYYQSIAAARFRLLRLSETHGAEAVGGAFKVAAKAH